MNFNAPEFPVFLLLVFIAHWTLPHRLRWVALLGASWLFYGWWDVRAGFLLLGVTLLSWLCAGGIDRAERPFARRALLALALAGSLGCLAYFKYAGFFASLIGRELTHRILLPVGISFYTFQSISYVVDVYRKRISAEGHFGYYALFVSFFPQLVAGPIERTEHLLPQLRAERTLRREDLSQGGWLLLEGYFKKLVIADRLAVYVDRIYGAAEAASGPEIVLATILFGLQIYCDFSGYSCIARGAARLLGIELMENFRRPYAARSVREFWRRWHISLTGWFTDYVYIPLGGSRRGLFRQTVNILIVFLLSGLWHGAGWSFVLWGFIHGLYLIAGTLGERTGRAAPGGRLRDTLRQIRTFLLVSFPWLFFRASSMAEAGLLLERLFTGWDGTFAAIAGVLPLTMPILCLPMAERLTEPGGSRSPTAAALTVFCGITAIGVAWLIQLAGGGENAFIYFRF